MIADQIKILRGQADMTQAGLAKRLGITRSSVNAWEMGISIPSTQYLVELAKLFHVSTDFLLGLASATNVNVSGLTTDDIQLVHTLIRHLQEKNEALGVT